MPKKKIDNTPIGQEINPLRHPDHRRPVTRREFLAQGFITGAATVTAPTLYSLFGRSGEALAQAVGCTPPPGGAGMIPFMCFDLGGGANIAGSNVLAGGPLGQMDLLSEGGYSKLGLPSEFMPGQSTPDLQINSELGLLFHSDSAMLQGILSKTTPATRAQVNGTIFCSRSLNDTENNELNPLYGIAKVGADGNLLTLIGSRSSISGGKSLPPAYLVDPALRPTKVSRSSDATGLVDAGRMADFLDAFGSARVVEAVERISHNKVDRIESLGEQQVASQILRTAYSDSTQLVQVYSDPDSLNPESDPIITGQLDSIFTAAEMNQSTFEKTAAAMKLTVEQHVGAACVELGGYDYHDSTRTTGDRRDLAAGQAIGAALEFAARSCNDLVIYVFSDGSVASNGQTDAGANGKGIWKGDNSSTAASFMLVYSKDTTAGRPQLVADPGSTSGFRHQLGFFRSDGSVDRDAVEFSNNPAKLAETAVLNYLALHGLDNEFSARLPEGTLGQVTPRDDMVAFEPIR